MAEAKRKRRRRGPATIVVVIGLLLALAAAGRSGLIQPPAGAAPGPLLPGGGAAAQPADAGTSPVRRDIGRVYQGPLRRVSDGDTVVIEWNGLDLHVRLLNVDTAESVHTDPDRNTAFGKQTSAWAKTYLADARVFLDLKTDAEGRLDTDRYGRALGFLWIDRGAPGADAADELYNLTLVRLGWSAYKTGFGDAGSYDAAFRAAEAAARSARLGRWTRGER